jgi:hypothetical protein
MAAAHSSQTQWMPSMVERLDPMFIVLDGKASLTLRTYEDVRRFLVPQDRNGRGDFKDRCGALPPKKKSAAQSPLSKNGRTTRGFCWAPSRTRKAARQNPASARNRRRVSRL